MAIIIETHGNLAPVYPENGRTFSLSEVIELMGPQLSIYELESATPKNLHDRAHYIVAIMNARENGLDRNESASNIYAQSMKGLVGGSVYGRVLVCKLKEIELEEIYGAEMISAKILPNDVLPLVKDAPCEATSEFRIRRK